MKPMRQRDLVERKLQAFYNALEKPANKFQERDRDWLLGASEALSWVLWDSIKLKSPEGDVQ